MEEYPRLINNLFTVEGGGITDPPAMYQKRNAVMCPVLFKGKKTLQRKKAEKYFCLFSSNKEGVPLQKICCDRHILPSVQDSNNGRY